MDITKKVLPMLFLSLLGCKSMQKNDFEKYKTGQVSVAELKRQKWFKTNYKSYIPNRIIEDSLNKFDHYSILIIGAEWCSDTRMQLPRFVKILESIRFPLSKMEILLVDRNKECPPCKSYSKEKYSIRLVPTFIIYDESMHEIGRIIESPTQTLEADLLKILRNHRFKTEG